MKACPSCSSWIPDAAAFCASCGAAAGNAAPSAVPEPAAPSPTPPPVPDTDPAKARARVRNLGTVYVVAGAIVLAWVALSFLQHASGHALSAIESMLDDPDPDMARMARLVKELYLAPWFLAVAHVVPFVFGVLFCWSGIRLRGLRGGTLGIVASSAMIVFGFLTCPCCCLWTPLGIWGLMVLTRGDSEAVLDTASKRGA